MATKKLIYADDARKAILHEAPHLAYCIDNLQVVDAVEVVRCKDCKHWYRRTSCSGECKSYDMGVYGLVGEDDFCSYGERKDK